MSEAASVDVRKACAQAAAQHPDLRVVQEAARVLPIEPEGAERMLQDELPFVTSLATRIAINL